jgi:hypothetical protein
MPVEQDYTHRTVIRSLAKTAVSIKNQDSRARCWVLGNSVQACHTSEQLPLMLN